MVLAVSRKGNRLAYMVLDIESQHLAY